MYEVYQDHPKQAKLNVRVVLAIAFLICAIGTGIFLITRLVSKPLSKEEARAKAGIVYDSAAVEGGWDNLSPEEIAEKLNEKVAEGMINISMNTAPYFEDSTAEGNLMIVNESINNYPQKVQIVRNDTGEQIYESGAIAVGTDGTVSTATDAKIVNNSFGAVKVNSVSIEAAQGWSLAAFGDKATLAREKVDSNKFGFQLSVGDGVAAATDNKDASKQALLTDAIEGCYMSGVGDTSANSIGIAYDAIVTPVSEAVTNTAIASVLFIIAWDAV